MSRFQPDPPQSLRADAEARSGDSSRSSVACEDRAEALASFEALHAAQEACRACPRLVAWREACASAPPPRFAGQIYHARAVPSWGERSARVLIVGLAPAAHGANRTGRLFTGDRSGDWLFQALWETGFASAPVSVARDDGTRLLDCVLTAACHCAPPANKPAPDELRACAPFLDAELQMLERLRVVVGLGKIGFDAAFDALRRNGKTSLMYRPRFGHGALHEVGPGLFLLGTYHPSQQNTFTGRLTRSMLRAVFEVARDLCEADEAGAWAEADLLDSNPRASSSSSSAQGS